MNDTTTSSRYSAPFSYGYGQAVKCLDCSTRSTVVALDPSLMAEHDALHAAGQDDGARVLRGQACGVCGQRFTGTHSAHYAASHSHQDGGK